MQRPRNRNRTPFRRAFTLVELLIVIIIIAVLAAIAIPKFANSSGRSKDSALRSNIKIARSAIEAFRADTGLPPVSLVDLTKEAGATAPTQGAGPSGTAINFTGTYRGPYVQAAPTDPVTNNDLGYTTTSGVPVVKASAATLAIGNDNGGQAYSTY